MDQNNRLIFNNLKTIKGIGSQFLSHLERLGIATVTDLLLHFPLRYQDRNGLKHIDDWRFSEGKIEWIWGQIEQVEEKKMGAKRQLTCLLSGEKKSLTLRFFHAQTYHLERFSQGAKVFCYGEIKRGFRGFEMIHPEVMMATGNDPSTLWPSSFWPVYPSNSAISQYHWRKWMKQALDRLLQSDDFSEWLPSSFLQKKNWFLLRDAMVYMHCPNDVSEQTLARARARIAFDELTAHQLSLHRLRHEETEHKAAAFQKKSTFIEQLIGSLPFRLTNAQHRVVKEILDDLKQPVPMLRLVQGDVGSGKTIVAALSLLHVMEAGGQTAMMAPTELLAEQHHRALSQWFLPLGFSVELLTSRVKGKARERVFHALKTGECKCVVGTHALFQKDVSIPHLSLAVIDEQHRFGVEQRALLLQKNTNNDCIPHQLIMTATPIPRTLFMSFYAHLASSVIDELPKGRVPVQTIALSVSRRNELLPRIKKVCLSGRQVYWVCGLIEEQEDSTREAVLKLHEFLEKECGELTIGVLHGKMNAEQKEETMRAFIERKSQVLVATTVIEVGVDVPNASIMIIENAECFGLAQLHQLRGRVGRGTQESYCVLLYKEPLSLYARKRLLAIRETTDGFVIAEQDLALRGPGEVLGTLQTGEGEFRAACLERDQHLFEEVSEMVHRLHAEPFVQGLIDRWWVKKWAYRRV